MTYKQNISLRPVTGMQGEKNIWVPNEIFENETQSKDFRETLTNQCLMKEA
jgi:hypothetical protein